MKHYVIGRGNLGLDLVQSLSAAGHEVRLLTASTGFDWKKDISMFQDADFVWLAAGFGSVEAAKKDFLGALETHAVMPVSIARGLPDFTKLIAFSTDYAADESAPWSPGSTNKNPRSLYAVTKISMEVALRSLNRKNTAAVRVCTLYGDHYPDRTFPGRLLARYPNPTSLALPLNRTTPTPTSWVADVMTRNLGKFTGEFRVHHCAPMGMTSVWQWGQMILGSDYKVESTGFDNTRPLCSNLQCSLEGAPDWLELWRLHWFQQKYHSPRPAQPALEELKEPGVSNT